MHIYICVCVCVCVYTYIWLYIIYTGIYTSIYMLKNTYEGQSKCYKHPQKDGEC